MVAQSPFGDETNFPLQIDVRDLKLGRQTNGKLEKYAPSNLVAASVDWIGSCSPGNVFLFLHL